jgi:hypothetical protein
MDSIDGWLLTLPSVLNKQKQTLVPVVRERTALVETRARLLQALGLERRPKTVATITEYLAAKGEKGHAPTAIGQTHIGGDSGDTPFKLSVNLYCFRVSAVPICPWPWGLWGQAHRARPRGPRVTILDALRDPHLFGGLPAFRDLASWQGWLAFLAASYGLPMTKAQLAAFRAHTGRQTPRPEGHSEVVAIVGRQAITLGGCSRRSAMTSSSS